MAFRLVGRRAALALVVALLALGSAPAFAADEDEETGLPDGPAGPTVIRVPYEGSLEVKPAPGWSFADCASVLAATPLITVCLPDTLTAAAPEFDPELEPVRVSIALTSATLQMVVDYLIVIEAPAKPAFDDLDYGFPFVAGGRALVPLSDLGISCGRCSPEAATVEIGELEPADAGAATVTGTHVVFAPRSGFTGAVEIGVRAYDDLGARSASSTLTLHIVAAGEEPLAGLHVVVEQEASETDGMVYETQAADLVLGETEGLTIIGCGAAVRGTVLCLPGGRIEYRAAEAVDLDQFSVHVQRPDGEQATASVTIVRTDTGSGTTLAPAIGERTAPLTVPVLAPPASTSQTASGVTAPFVDLLDRVGG